MLTAGFVHDWQKAIIASRRQPPGGVKESLMHRDGQIEGDKILIWFKT